MDNNLIFEAFAFQEDANVSSSMSSVSGAEVYEIYLKNIIVSLVSVKEHNPNTTVALVTNLTLPEYWSSQLISKAVEIWFCPFDNFRVPKEWVYALSYYKLCAFDFVVREKMFEKYCFIDCDTISFKNYADIWKEVESAFLIVQNLSPYYSQVRKEINDLYSSLFYKQVETVTHWSSGFIAANRSRLLEVLSLCYEVHNRLTIYSGKHPVGGDEIIWSMALADYNGRMRDLRPYCLLSYVSLTNYWIDKEFYDDPNVVMWHLPGDKRYSLIWIYNYYIKKGRLPEMKKIASASRIRKVRTYFSLLAIKAILLDKTAIKRNLNKYFSFKR